MSIILVLLQALWFIWPAYCANAFPTVVRGKIPVDCGRFFGKSRVLGSSKTVEGTIAGILFGIIIGSIQMNLYSAIPSSYGLFQFSFSAVILLSTGALVGDIAGSFIKRRIGIKPGEPAVLLDQLGFLVLAIMFAGVIYFPPLYMIFVLIVITPVIHVGTNVVAYSLKLKKHPW